MASKGMLAAFAIAIIAIAMWAGWVVRTHRARAYVKALPLIVLLLVAVFEALAIDTMSGRPYDGGVPTLARSISQGMRYLACAWGSVGLAFLWLGVLSLRAPNDPDAPPSARVVREPRRDR